MVQLLIHLGCPVGLTTLGDGSTMSSGATAMHVAAVQANCEPSDELLAVMRALADVAADLITARDDDGTQPLHWAADWATGKTVAMRFLLDRDAPINAQDNEGATVLHMAVYKVRD